MKLTNKPKLNHLRVNVTVHKLRHGREVALSYESGGIIHRTKYCRTSGVAQQMLKSWLSAATGVGFVSLIATTEVLHEKGDL